MPAMHIRQYDVLPPVDARCPVEHDALFVEGSQR